jgi:ParB-like chromosome segregation protein Spo0J
MADDAALSWPADQVERRPLSDLIPNARNARTHSDGQVAQLAGSIREWGWTIPVLVDEAGTLIAGHGRVLAAHQLGLDTVPVMVARGWSDAKKRAYMIADNRLTEIGGWDFDLLTVELGALDPDLRAAVGFTEAELAALLNNGGLPPDLDDMPDETDDKAFWPQIKVQVPDETFALWCRLVGEAPGAEEHERVAAVLEAVRWPAVQAA